MKRNRFVLILILSLLYFLTGETGCALNSVPIPNSGTYIGAFSGGNIEPKSFNKLIGTHHAFFIEYVNFPTCVRNEDEKNYLLTQLKQIKQAGSGVVLNLECWDGLDSYNQEDIKTFVKLIKPLSMPVLINWNHEMNSSWYPWGQQPTLYIEKFREFSNYVHSNLPNASMVWSPNSTTDEYPWRQSNTVDPNLANDKTMDTNSDGVINNKDDPYFVYYPGDEYVDWVGLSIFYKGPIGSYYLNIKPPDNYFLSELTYFYSQIALKTNKPMMISETSAFYDPANLRGGDENELNIKTSWINQIYNAKELSNAFPLIKLISWFNEIKAETDKTNNWNSIIDWRISSNNEVLKVYTGKLQDKYFIKNIPVLIDSSYLFWSIFVCVGVIVVLVVVYLIKKGRLKSKANKLQ